MVNITYGDHGRGAWNNAGVGGTRKLDRILNKTVKGPYYMAPVNSDYMIGLDTSRKVAAGDAVTIDEYAVWLGVKAIQTRLNVVLSRSLVVDGIIGPKTDVVIKELQGKLGVTQDGMIGPNTSSALFLGEAKTAAARWNVDWTVVAGIVKSESSWDAGAVGYIDVHDFGLGQVNHTSHPEYSVEQLFDYKFALDYSAKRYQDALAYFNGAVRDAIASYNLGYAGTLEWIRKGRPDVWTPSWDTVPRDTKKYIDDILAAY